MDRTARGWTVTLAGTGINLALGVLYTWSVFAAALTEQLHWSKTAASLPYTVACAVFAIMMVPAGRMQDRIGPRKVATLGGILAGGGLILSSFTHSLQMLTITFGIMVGMGIGLGYAAPTPSAVKWFPPQKKGLISGIVVAGFGLAALYIAPMTNSFIKSFGINGAFRIEGIAFLLAITLFAQILAIPSDNPNFVSAKEENTELKLDHTWQQMIKRPQFYLLWIMFASGATAGLMVIGHLSKIAKMQAEISWGYAMVALLAIFNAGGRIFAGWLSDRIGRIWTMRLFFGVQAVNMFLFVNYQSAAAMAIGASIAGLCYGALLSLFPSITYDYFGAKHGGVNYGLIFTAWGVGGVLGPMVAGAVADATKSYSMAYTMAAILCGISVMVTFALEKPDVLVSSESEAQAS